MPRNPLRESLEAGRFCHVVEIVASRISREARLLEVASHLAAIPGVVAGSITSYAGGAPGQDPIRVGTAARARGLTPNIHVTCVSKDRGELRHLLETVNGLGLENVFALTGDYPKGSTPVFDVDSVELVTMMNDYRRAGMPFWIAAAVSPFKYTEADCMYQYLKLEKKFAAGADYAITQLGFDVRKFRELRRYMHEHGIQKPILGNVYVLSLRAAEKMAKGEPPGCWVAPELVEKIRGETKLKDSGEAARLERASRMVAILRGLGYAGAYIGGTHKAEHLRWIIERGQQLAPRWEELAEEFTYAPKSAFYVYDSPKTPTKPLDFWPRVFNFLGCCPFVRKHLSGKCYVLYSLGSTGVPAWRIDLSARSSQSSHRCSAARPAGIACSGTWSMSARKLVRSNCETARAAAPVTANVKSFRSSHAFGSKCMSARRRLMSSNC